MFRLALTTACLLAMALSGCLGDGPSQAALPMHASTDTGDTSDLPATDVVAYRVLATGPNGYEATLHVEMGETVLGPDAWLRDVPQVRPTLTTIAADGEGIPVTNHTRDGGHKVDWVQQKVDDTRWYSAQDGRLLRFAQFGGDHFADQTRPVLGAMGALAGFAVRSMGVDEPLVVFPSEGQDHTLTIEDVDAPQTGCTEYQVTASWTEQPLQTFCLDDGAITPQWAHSESDFTTYTMVRTTGDTTFAWAEGEYAVPDVDAGPWTAVGSPLGGKILVPPSSGSSLDYEAMAEAAALDPNVAPGLDDGPLVLSWGISGWSEVHEDPVGLAYADSTLVLEGADQTYFSNLRETTAGWVPQPTPMGSADGISGPDPANLPDLVSIGTLEGFYGGLHGFSSFNHWSFPDGVAGAWTATVTIRAACDQEGGYLHLSMINGQIIYRGSDPAPFCVAPWVPLDRGAVEPPERMGLADVLSLYGLQGHSKPF